MELDNHQFDQIKEKLLSYYDSNYWINCLKNFHLNEYQCNYLLNLTNDINLIIVILSSTRYLKIILSKLEIKFDYLSKVKLLILWTKKFRLFDNKNIGICNICLEDITLGSSTAVICNNCRNATHTKCKKNWFKHHKICEICKIKHLIIGDSNLSVQHNRGLFKLNWIDLID